MSEEGYPVRTKLWAVLVLGVFALTACSQVGGARPAAQKVPLAPPQSEAPQPTSPSTGTVEREVLALFKGGATPATDASRIIALLPDLNWSVYERASGGRSIDLLEWLDQRQIDDVHEIESVLRGTTGLDGAYSEAYSNVAGTLFTADPAKFVQALAVLTEGQADRIDSFVAYYASYQRPDIPPAREKLQDLAQSSALPAPAAQRAAGLLRAIDSPPWK